MRHEKFTPMEYRHEQLIWDLNEFMIAVKVHLYKLPVKKPLPTAKEIDEMHSRLMAVLREDCRPMVR